MAAVSSRAAETLRRPRNRVVAGVLAVAIAVSVAVGAVVTSGGDTSPATGTLTPLAPDGVASPGVVQLEPGDTAPSGGSSAVTSLAGGPGIAVADALASTLSGPLLVNGFVVIVDEAPRLCSALAESFPPQCAGGSVPVVGLDATTLDLGSERNVRWTAGQVQLLGTVRDGELRIDALSLAGGGAPPLPTPAD